MKNRINVAELLTDCPQGMELDCTMFENVTFRCVETLRCQFPIEILVDGKYTKYLTKEGCYHDITLQPKAKCVIFPKGKTTWEGFQRPTKDGDIVVCEKQKKITKMFIVQSEQKEGRGKCYFGYDFEDDDFFEEDIWEWDRLATEEEKEKLFKAIKDNGYKWNPETKELEKLIQPQFKVGDWIIRNNKYTGIPVKVIEFNGYYSCELNGEVVNLTLNDVHNNFHLWTIQDAKDGNIISYDSGWTCIFKRIHGIWYSSYCFITSDGEFHTGYEEHDIDATINGNAHPATEDQCRFLFQKIKEKGYKWNPETKTLEKLIELKFKVGDRIRHKEKTKWTCVIRRIDDRYWVDEHPMCYTLPFGKQDEYELVPDKFDITTLKPFDKILVRDADNGMWIAALFSHLRETRFYTVSTWYNQCIPFENNEHLLGKTDDCDEFYKTWTNEEE